MLAEDQVGQLVAYACQACIPNLAAFFGVGVAQPFLLLGADGHFARAGFKSLRGKDAPLKQFAPHAGANASLPGWDTELRPGTD